MHRGRARDDEPGSLQGDPVGQIRLSETEFWEVLRTKRPAQRPSPAPESAPSSLPLWLAQALEREVGLTREQIAKLDEDTARRLLDEARSKPTE